MKEEDVAQYRREGYVVLGGVLSADLVAACLEALDDIAQAPRDGASFALEPGAKAIRKFADFTDAEPALLRAAMSKPLHAALDALMGAGRVMFQEMALVKPPRVGGEKRWHQDAAYFRGSDADLVFGVWIALDPATRANGCMQVVPGSQRDGPVPHLPDEDINLCTIDPAFVRREASVELPMQPGDALVFHSLIHHHTEANRSDLPRRALQFHYHQIGLDWTSLGDHAALYHDAHGTYAGCTVPRGGPIDPASRMVPRRLRPVVPIDCNHHFRNVYLTRSKRNRHLAERMRRSFREPVKLDHVLHGALWEHDLRLLVVAVAVPVLGVYVTLTLMQHVETAHRRVRNLWLLAAAGACGGAIWTAHFVALLAFHPMDDVGYAIGITLLSLLTAMLLSGAGLAIAVARPAIGTRALGGGVLGLGIGSMHYLGMSGVGASIEWNQPRIAASVLLGVVLASVALVLGFGTTRRLRRRLAGTFLLTLAILSVHFVGVSAMSLAPDLYAEPPTNTMSGPALALVIACACFMLLALAQFGVFLDRVERRRHDAETGRMRDLANAAAEGLLVCDRGTIIAANSSFAAMTGFAADALISRPLSQLFGKTTVIDCHSAASNTVEGDVVAANGERIPVEIFARDLVYGGQAHRVLALRDLRQRRAAEAQIRHLAYHDPLTDLVNRAAFCERLEREAVFSRRVGDLGFAVLIIDLDRFKAVNDTLGHGVGDLLLKSVGDRLRGAVRAGDMIARLGGDEFAILQADMANPDQAGELADRIVEQISRPYLLADHTVEIGCSIGIAIGGQADGDGDTLLKNADRALYRAKAEGRGGFRYFEAEMDAAMQKRLQMEIDLRQAVAREEFELHYQPQLALREDVIKGFEALLRWRHPEFGLIAPGDFIPLAEETGLIVPIGAWVLQTAMTEATNWSDDITVSINLSAVQFRGGRLVQTVRDALAKSGLMAERVELEITESVLLQESACTLAILHELKELGVRISMDDFGTGYSSLSYLRSFPFDRIKIDRSFVQDLGGNGGCKAIVRAILGLGRSLGIATTAEGVETGEQLEYLRTEGCDDIQGFLIGRPMAAPQPLKAA